MDPQKIANVGQITTVHLVALIDIGYQLEIRSIYNEHQNLAFLLCLDEEQERTFALQELAQQGLYMLGPEDRPSTCQPIPLESVAEIAQAIQWVRAYVHASSQYPGWRASFADLYTEALIQALVTKIIGLHTVSWHFEATTACNKT
jgi:hypothetical protein